MAAYCDRCKRDFPEDDFVFRLEVTEQQREQRDWYICRTCYDALGDWFAEGAERFIEEDGSC